MKYRQINRWLLILSNLSVLAGVLFLALEVRQNHLIMKSNQDLAQLESSHIDVERFRAWRDQIIDDENIADLYVRGSAGETLTQANQFRYDMLCNDLFWAAILMHERSVVLDRQEFEEATIIWMRSLLIDENLPGLRTCWNDLRDVYLLWGYDEFVELVE